MRECIGTYGRWSRAGSKHQLPVRTDRMGILATTPYAPPGMVRWEGVKSIYVGLLDSRPDTIKVQSNFVLGDFGQVDSAWNWFQVPLKKFGAKGMYWDAAKMTEMSDEVKWDRINEIRFSENKDENKPGPGRPIAFNAKDIVITNHIPNYLDPDEFWMTFNSSEPDVVLAGLNRPTRDGKRVRGPNPRSDSPSTRSRADRGNPSISPTAWRIGATCSTDLVETGAGKNFGIKTNIGASVSTSIRIRPFKASPSKCMMPEMGVFVANVGLAGESLWGRLAG